MWLNDEDSAGGRQQVSPIGNGEGVDAGRLRGLHGKGRGRRAENCAGNQAPGDPFGYAAAEDDGARRVEGAEERSGHGWDRSGGIHRTVAEECGTSATGRGLRVSGQSRTEAGTRLRGPAGGAGP